MNKKQFLNNHLICYEKNDKIIPQSKISYPIWMGFMKSPVIRGFVHIAGLDAQLQFLKIFCFCVVDHTLNKYDHK